MAATEQMLATIEAQRAYFASDEHLEERAAIWRDATPEECLEAVIDLCSDADYFLSLKDPEMLQRVLAPPPIPADTVAILEALQRSPIGDLPCSTISRNASAPASSQRRAAISSALKP